MTDDEMLAKIAEACGQTVIKVPFVPHDIKHRDQNTYFTSEALIHYRQAYPNSSGAKPLPDYLNDLNACHEMEKTLTDSQWDEYERHLRNIVGCDTHYLSGVRGLVSATARQRCEAFLVVI